MLTYVLAILILVSAFPVGGLLKKLTKEELSEARFFITLLLIVSIVLIVLISILKLNLFLKLTILFTLAYIIIVSLISIRKHKK